jgi:mono/diheme cytochrome c family protein
VDIVTRVRRVAILAAAFTAVAGAAVYLFVLRNGLTADRPPSRIETAIAHRIVRLSIPAAHRTAQNPLGGDAEAWRTGSGRFTAECASCHGPAGRGTEIGRAMYPPVPDLANDEIQTMSDGALFAVIRNGIRWTGMPAFGRHQQPQDTWALVSYVRHLSGETAHGRSLSIQPRGPEETKATTW